MALNEEELRSALEAIIFVSGEPVKIEDLYDAFSDEDKASVDAQLEQLMQTYRERNGGIYIEQTAGGYRFATRADLDPALRKFFAIKNEGRLSIAALETLAIVAYKQPMTAPEIQDIRGVNSSGVLRTLLDRKMIRIAGRKNVVGSPFLYRTTKDFLVHFGLNDIQNLPRLEEFAEVLGENLSEELLGAGPSSEYLRGEEDVVDVVSDSEGVDAGSDATNAEEHQADVAISQPQGETEEGESLEPKSEDDVKE